MRLSVVWRLIYRSRRRAYRAAYLGDDGTPNENGKVMLADLRKYCHATDTTFAPDPYQTAMREGRRQVFNRICSYLSLTEQQIYQLTESMEGMTDDN